MRVIKLIDAAGNRQHVQKKGRMGITRHTKVMSALEKRALRYRRKGHDKQDQDEALYNAAVDETGTVSTQGLTDSDEDSVSTKGESAAGEYTNVGGSTVEIEASIKEISEIQGVADELLTVHGVAPGPKPEGVTRMIYENLDGINTRICGNEKLEKEKEIIDELEADLVGIVEHKINVAHKDNVNGLGQMFRGGEAEIRTQTGHNVHENVGRIQQGGTGLLLYGPLIEQYNFELSGKDDTGLGRWVVMTFQGEEGKKTRVVAAYCPCVTPPKATKSSYQQHKRYLVNKEKDYETCPRTRFREDLIKQLRLWREEGDRLIVCMDANENIYKKSIGRMLTDPGGLAMKEVVGDFTGKKLGATFFRGVTPIDGFWATPDVIVTAACVMPVGYGAGDHRMFVIDFLTSSLVGSSPPRIVRAEARRLNTNIPGVADRYYTKLEDQVMRHRMMDRIGQEYTSSNTKELAKQKWDKLDEEMKRYMKGAEKKCRRIKSGRIPFSPEASKWIRRAQVYRSLLRFHAGKIRNRGNLKRAARRCGISRPLSLSLVEIRARLKVCKDKCNYFKKHGHRYRRKHLHTRLENARRRRNEEAEKRIIEIIAREKQRAHWRRLNYSMAKPKGRSVRVVSVEIPGGGVREVEGQAEVENVLWSNIHNQRFYLGEQAPICKGQMRNAFGYLATTIAARQVLAGTYTYPAEFDTATKELCEVCARIRLGVPANSVKTTIRGVDWSYRWGRAKEKTSSSESGLHFGHYKAAARSPMLSHLHALKTTLALKRGFALERWSRGLSVMLEKMFGCTLVSKLRAILLMEADFNFSNKLIYGVRMMDNVRRYGHMPDEIYSEKGKTADDGSLAKVLFYDIVRQSRVAAGLSSIDAANCYDSIAHAIASLVFQAFGVPAEAIESMLKALEDMKYFLRTAYGDSKRAVGSRLEVKFQGLCQGNGAAPAGWAVISITILHAHKEKGHGAQFVCPISRTTGKLAAILFVDDTDIIHIDLNQNQGVEEAHASLQESVYNWGRLLLATGGAFKPPKCFYYLVSFSWRKDGKWRYASNEGNEELDIVVPMPNKKESRIAHLSVDTAKETLGVHTCPSGKGEAQIEAMQEKTQEWLDRAKEGKLRRKDVWFLLDHQLWPRVGYGLCSLAAEWKLLDDCLRNKWWQLVPLGGIAGSAPHQMRDTNIGFYGGGCQHVGIECLIAQAKKLLMHYGCDSNDGLEMRTSLEYMILELGISSQPFRQKYSRFQSWVTECWMKSLWEKCDKFEIEVNFREDIVSLPREGDKWLMLVLKEAGFTGEELARLNRVRIHQQALFLSCVLGASGKSLDEKYIKRRPIGERWSSLNFPNECPPQKDFTLWAKALRQIAPAGGIQDRLGRFRHKGYKVWDWRFEVRGRRLLHNTDEGLEVYVRPEGRATRQATRWVLTEEVGTPTEEGLVCSVREATRGSKVIVSTADAPRPTAMPETMLEVLEDWGCLWIWSSLRLVGDDHWLEEAIEAGTCRAVTDGSYIKELYPNICSAAFVFECSEGKGRIIGSFPEQATTACAYRGELLGLLAIHLILLAANKVRPSLEGTVDVISDCLGALTSVADLPPTRIPSRCSHSDILKTIMVNCSNLSFSVNYQHVRAHQDDTVQYHKLSRPSQLNCVMDLHAKRVIWGLEGNELPPQRAFPLEPVSIFVGKEKMTSDTGERIRFWAHKKLARKTFHDLGILPAQAFDEVAWRQVYDALHTVPRLFQLWAAKQVFDVAGTNLRQSYYKPGHDRKCPSCSQEVETCSHVLHCEEEGRVEALLQSIKWMDEWLRKVGTDPTLRRLLVRYAKGRGRHTLEQLAFDEGPEYKEMGSSQDEIGWQRFMEGMVSREIISLQEDYAEAGGCTLTTDVWAQGLIVKLLETTHGQWLYRNVQVHDTVSGIKATERKEEIQKYIEDQIEIGEEGLDEKDHFLLEINLRDLESSSGEDQHYWLLQIAAARRAHMLRYRRDQGDSRDNQGRERV